jgi:hypothetical protein
MHLNLHKTNHIPLSEVRVTTRIIISLLQVITPRLSISIISEEEPQIKCHNRIITKQR